jgi:hypothetical protein
MTTTQATDTNPFALTELHIEAIGPAHKTAFRGPVIRDYAVGALVWMWDHYNTATIEGPGRAEDSWKVITTDADGTMGRYEYPSAHLRPAQSAVDFRWPAEFLPTPEFS